MCFLSLIFAREKSFFLKRTRSKKSGILGKEQYQGNSHPSSLKPGAGGALKRTGEAKATCGRETSLATQLDYSGWTPGSIHPAPHTSARSGSNTDLSTEAALRFQTEGLLLYVGHWWQSRCTHRITVSAKYRKWPGWEWGWGWWVRLRLSSQLLPLRKPAEWFS